MTRIRNTLIDFAWTARAYLALWSLLLALRISLLPPWRKNRVLRFVDNEVRANTEHLKQRIADLEDHVHTR